MYFVDYGWAVNLHEREFEGIRVGGSRRRILGIILVLPRVAAVVLCVYLRAHTKCATLLQDRSQCLWSGAQRLLRVRKNGPNSRRNGANSNWRGTLANSGIFLCPKNCRFFFLLLLFSLCCLFVLVSADDHALRVFDTSLKFDEMPFSFVNLISSLQAAAALCLHTDRLRRFVIAVTEKNETDKQSEIEQHFNTFMWTKHR